MRRMAGGAALAEMLRIAGSADLRNGWIPSSRIRRVRLLNALASEAMAWPIVERGPRGVDRCAQILGDRLPRLSHNQRGRNRRRPRERHGSGMPEAGFAADHLEAWVIVMRVPLVNDALAVSRSRAVAAHVWIRSWTSEAGGKPPMPMPRRLEQGLDICKGERSSFRSAAPQARFELRGRCALAACGPHQHHEVNEAFPDGVVGFDRSGITRSRMTSFAPFAIARRHDTPIPSSHAYRPVVNTMWASR